MKTEEWESQYREWLENNAMKLRETSLRKKKDCKVLMKYLDNFPAVSYVFRPAIMLTTKCKGYIPDLLVILPGDVKIVFDFVNRNKTDEEYILEKGEDLEADGYFYRTAPKGILKGEESIAPEEFMSFVAESFSEK